MADKLGNGGRKGKGTPKDKNGKRITMKDIHNVKNDIYVADFRTFKSIQIDMGGWIHLDPELDQHELNRILSRAIKNIKYRLSNMARRTGKYHLSNIVIIDTGDINYSRKARNYQYLNIYVTLFNKTDIYDKMKIRATFQPIIQEIIENDLQDERVFEFLGGKVRATGQYE